MNLEEDLSSGRAEPIASFALERIELLVVVRRPNEERGVFKTVDGGKTWNKVLYQGDNVSAIDLTMNHSNPDELFASMWEFERKAWGPKTGGGKSGLWHSTDAGKTWTDISKNNGMPAGQFGRIHIPRGRGSASTMECSLTSTVISVLSVLLPISILFRYRRGIAHLVEHLRPRWLARPVQLLGAVVGLVLVAYLDPGVGWLACALFVSLNLLALPLLETGLIEKKRTLQGYEAVGLEAAYPGLNEPERRRLFHESLMLFDYEALAQPRERPQWLHLLRRS